MCMIYCLICMSESPKWLYVNKYYDEVRNVMYDMQAKNGVEEDDRVKFRFKEEEKKSDSTPGQHNDEEEIDQLI